MNNIPDNVIEVTGDITCTDCGLSAFAIGGGGGNVEPALAKPINRTDERGEQDL